MNALFVGLKGSVVAIDRTSGDTLWSTKLKGSEFVTLSIEDGEWYAATRGRVYRLDPTTGDVQWSNELPGLGYGIVSFVGSSGGPAERRRREQQSHAAAGA